MTRADHTRPEPRHMALASKQFIQIPGPNPILVPGEKGCWDDDMIEAADVFKDNDTYYLYYHATGGGKGYRLGVATASHPLGPWTKYEGNPIVDIGQSGQWDDRQLGCALILKDGIDKYYMWYSGSSVRDDHQVWHVGLATAATPLGPWVKHEANPIIEDFGYVGGVVKVGDEFRMYNEHPIGGTGRDYGPIALAVAPTPAGPWKKHKGGPVLPPGEMGCWDDGGFSEAKVSYKDGVFHLFYGGAKLHPTRICTKESIGYAYSFDGVNFVKHPDNPIAVREKSPDAAAFAEVHSYCEHPFVYLYHTLRYNSREGDEDMGVQVLATQRPFRLRASTAPRQASL